MTYMFINLLTINQDIIIVNDYKLINKSTQHMIHHSHKSTRCISKSKRHNQPLIQTIFSFKSSFSFIPFFHPNLMIPLFKSIFENNLEPCNSSNISSNLGMGCWYFTVMLLITQQSIHIHQFLSIFGTRSTRTAQGLMLSRMYPSNINSPTCLWSSLVSSGLLLYAGLFGIDAPITKSIWCSIPLIGRNH